MNELPLRPNVCMLVYNREDRLFLGERAGSPGVWQLPQGGVDEDFSLKENVLRELEEELGASQDLFRIQKKLHATNEYDWQTAPDYAKGKWRGQSQTFWIVEFLGEDQDIQLDRYEAEFMTWRWCSPLEAPGWIEPIRIAGCAPALREFSDFLLLRGEF